MDLIRKAVEDGANTRILSLERVQITMSEFDVIFQTLPPESNIQTLELISCRIDEHVLEVLLIELRKRCSLRAIRLFHLGLTDKTARLLAEFLREENSIIKVIDVRTNRIGPEGARVIAEAAQGSVLQWLLIDWNRIGDDGFGHIVQLLSTGNTCLTRLGLANNQITSNWYPALSEVLKHSNIRELNVDRHQGITFTDIRSICQSFIQSGKVKFLSLQSSHLGDFSMVEIAELIIKTKLVGLKLRGNLFTDCGLVELGKAIRVSTTMEELHIERTHHITDQGIRQFIDSIKCHSSFKSLSLDDSRRVSYPVRAWASDYVDNLQSKKSKLLVTLASVQFIRRISTNATIRHIPIDLLRRVADCL